jgi:hypothetical protein
MRAAIERTIQYEDWLRWEVKGRFRALDVDLVVDRIMGRPDAAMKKDEEIVVWMMAEVNRALSGE